MKEYLSDKLNKYFHSGVYPYHMPGHKRISYESLSQDIASIDITEIDGFDNLNHPEDMYIDLQNDAAKAYNAKEAYFLVNGSTVGILAAISALVPEKGTLLTVRGAHKSVYNAACLHRVNLEYIYPSTVANMSFTEAVTAREVEEKLQTISPDAVLIVSPTYEGRYADVEAISKVVHSKGIPLIVDCAHGAHLGLLEGFPANPVSLGADVVIVSTHKTLPALTQTAILLVGEGFNGERIKKYISMYQTSSPSYVLTSSIDNSLRVKMDVEAQKNFLERFRSLVDYINTLKNIFIPVQDDLQDVGKLILAVHGNKLCGKELYKMLLDNYKLQPEMAGEDYVLLMFTISDSKEGYERLKAALKDIDHIIDAKNNNICEVTQVSQQYDDYKNIKIAVLSRENRALPIYEAYDSESENVPLEDAKGRVSAEYICTYPPGIPVVVPGEIVDTRVIETVKMKIAKKLSIQGVFNE